MADSERGTARDAHADRGRPFAELADSGMLWLVNRSVFHPRGFALALHLDEAGNATGWSVKGDGAEPWAFLMDAEEDARFHAASQTLADAKAAGGDAHWRAPGV
jgi:hypothetical protein